MYPRQLEVLRLSIGMDTHSDGGGLRSVGHVQPAPNGFVDRIESRLEVDEASFTMERLKEASH